MKPKIAEMAPAYAWELLGQVRQLVDALPELIEVPAYVMGVRVSADIATAHTIPNCHIMARAIATLFPVDVHDGKVSVMAADGKRRILDHSWLTLQGYDPAIILDPWPLGSIGGPTLFIQDYAYHFGPECSYLEHRGEEFCSHLEAVTKVVQQTAKRLWPDRFSHLN